METADQYDHYMHQQRNVVDVGVLYVSVQGSLACWWLIGEHLVMFFPKEVKYMTTELDMK